MLKVNHVSMLFGGLVSNDNISLEVNEGEIYGLIGPNGAGKTTLFNIISGLYKPTKGEIILNGEKIQGLPSNEIAFKGIARTYQNINLFKKMTVLENVMVGCHTQSFSGLIDAILKTKRSQIEYKNSLLVSHEALRFMKIDHLANSLASSLSYGDQRRLEIARALASKPKLLLLDEPAAGMNLKEKNELAETIKLIRDSGYTIILVEHHMKLIMSVCDRVGVLNHGVMIAEGTPKEIQQNSEVIKAYLGEQKYE